MLNRRASALFSAACLASSAALAQPAPAPAAPHEPSAPVSPLIVQTPASKLIQKQTRSFVRSYAAAANPTVDQIGRWHGPVCVGVEGLPMADQAAVIKARIDRMAQTLGLPAPRPGCKVNVGIVFTDQPQGAMDIVAQRYARLLGYYHREKKVQLKTVTHPIQAWYVTATKGDAFALAAQMAFNDLLSSSAQPVTDAVDDPQNATPGGCLSRFTSCRTSSFYSVLIVADSKVLDGKKLRAVADDMVMLSLSQPKSLDGCNALPSVIDQFARSPCPGRDPPRGLTPADSAYLAALYSADPESKKPLAQNDIANRMAKILITAGAVAAAEKR
jgi:hypothetical protein